MAKYARKYSRKFSKRHRRGRSRRGSSRNGGFSKRVMAVVRKAGETKIARSEGDFDLGVNITGPDTLSSGDIHKFFPDVSQGTGAEGRIGKQITALSLNVKFWAQFTPNNDGIVQPSQGNVTARIWILKQKNIASDHTMANNNSLTQTPYFRALELLNAPTGNASFLAANTYKNIMSPLNRELFTSAMEKKMNLKSLIYTNTGNSDPVTSIVEAPSNFKKWTQNFKWKSGKKFNYMEPSSTQPQAWPWIITGGLVNTNGSVPTSGRIKVFYSATLKYTDC